MAHTQRSASKSRESELVPLLQNESDLSAITLLEYLQNKYSGEYPDSLHRTLQRRVKTWRALHGSGKDVMFRQEHPLANKVYLILLN